METEDPTPPRVDADRGEDTLAMQWCEEPERFVLVGFSGAPDSADLELLAALDLAQCVREGGVTTLLVPERHLTALRERHPGLESEGPLCWIRFEAPMAWDVIGFLARVTGHLARAGVPLGAVCSYHRDHLFVNLAHRDRARAGLAELFPEFTPS